MIRRRSLGEGLLGSAETGPANVEVDDVGHDEGDDGTRGRGQNISKEEQKMIPIPYKDLNSTGSRSNDKTEIF